MILNPVQRQKAKHFNVQYHWVRENHKTGRLQYYHLEGAKQPADMFTKALPLVTLQRHLREIGFGKIYQYTMYNKYTVNVFTGAGVPSRGCRRHKPQLSTYPFQTNISICIFILYCKCCISIFHASLSLCNIHNFTFLNFREREHKSRRFTPIF